MHNLVTDHKDFSADKGNVEQRAQVDDCKDVEARDVPRYSALHHSADLSSAPSLQHQGCFD